MEFIKKINSWDYDDDRFNATEKVLIDKINEIIEFLNYTSGRQE